MKSHFGFLVEFRENRVRHVTWMVGLAAALLSITAHAVTLDVVPTASHCGAYGLKVTFSDTTPGYVQDNSSAAESRYVVQFYFNASAASLSGSGVEVFTAYSGTEGSGTPAFQVFLEPTGVSGAVAAVTASGVGVTLSSPVAVTPGWHRVQVDWQVGAGTGSMLVSFDGSTIINETSVSNSGATVEYVRMGALSGISASTGSVFFDDFDSRRTGPIGAVVCAAGSGSTDTVGIYRDSDRQWYLRNSNTPGFANIEIPYGAPSDVSIVGDWNGDGIDTVGIYRDSAFYLRNSNTAGFADIVVGFGAPGDIPVSGDWNGDGVDTIGVYRPSAGAWFLRNTNTGGTPDISFTYGLTNETPVTGDWDGDGVDTVGIFRSSDRSWYLRNSNSPGASDIDAIPYGDPANDIPVTGDWDGDGIDTFGVYRFGTGDWFLRNSNTPGFADVSFTYGIVNEKPVVGDWDGQ